MANVPTEYEECVTFAKWLDIQRLTYSHIPNETFTKYWGVKMKNKKMGVRKGVPDYIIILPSGLVFVEMKRRKGGAISDEQKHWVDQLNNLPGVAAKVCKGAEEAINFVSEFR